MGGLTCTERVVGDGSKPGSKLWPRCKLEVDFVDKDADSLRDGMLVDDSVDGRTEGDGLPERTE
jgi:hypothetical protein